MSDRHCIWIQNYSGKWKLFATIEGMRGMDSEGHPCTPAEYSQHWAKYLVGQLQRRAGNARDRIKFLPEGETPGADNPDVSGEVQA